MVSLYALVALGGSRLWFSFTLIIRSSSILTLMTEVQLDQDHSDHAYFQSESSSARLPQQSCLSSKSFVLLNVILLEPHGDPLSHL